MHIHNKFTYLLPILLLSALTACGDAEITEMPDAPVTEEAAADNVTFQLSTTRGTLLPAISDDELISSYLIVVTQGGTIVKVLHNAALPAAEMHAVKASLSAGSYKVYAFANIPYANAGDWLYGKFTVGASMSDLSQMYFGDVSYASGYTGRIPMSSVEEGLDLEVLASKGNTTYGIEVVRMIAKVEFVFMNSSQDAIEVNQVMMGPLTKPDAAMTEGYIPLSGYDDSGSLRLYTTPTLSCGVQDYVHDLGTSISLAAGSMGDDRTNVVRFNVIESNPDPITGQFHLRFRVKYNGEWEERWALLDKTQVTSTGTNLDGDSDRSPFIRRNDWIRIPIDLGDYEVKLEARSYPPIGGYPETDVQEDGSVFRVKFTSQGDFAIRPVVRQFGTTDWIYLDDTSRIESYSFTVDTTSEGLTNIFSKTPAKRGNEIVGAIKGGVHGTALVTLSVNIKLPGGVTRTLTRKMYITI